MAEEYPIPQILVVNPNDDQKSLIRSFFDQNKFRLHQYQLSWVNQDGLGVSIKEVRNLIKELNFSSFQGSARAVIIFEADSASIAAQNALLKTLEEPPSSTQIYLVTAFPNQLLPTIRSRCLMNYELVGNQASSQDWSEDQAFFDSIIGAADYGELINLADKLSQRDAAMQKILNLLNYLVQIRLKDIAQSDIDRHKLRKYIGHLNTAYLQLQKNCNPRLTVENCFFSMYQ